MYDFFCVYHDQFVDAFQRLDADQSGTLKTEEFVAALRNLYSKLPSGADLKRIIAPHVREGTVNYREFLSGIKFINKKYLVSAHEDEKKKAKKTNKKKKKKKKNGGKAGRRQRGNTRVIMPICTQDEGPRVADGGPPAVYLDKKVLVTDLLRFGRDRRPRHPIEDDSGWYLAAPHRSRVHFRDLVRARDVNSLCVALGITQEQSGSVRPMWPSVTDDNYRRRPELVDRFYKTPLMVACSSGDLQLVKLLISGG